MHRPAFLLLAACWSKPAPAPPSTGTSPAPLEVASKTDAEAPPPPPAKPAYVLPAGVQNALAAEPLAGNVLVPAGTPLYPGTTAARTGLSGPGEGTPRAMAVVKDHGNVVELSTARAQDCMYSFDEPYQLVVVVPRKHLQPRAGTEVVKTFPDGTAIVIDRGAPIAVTPAGLQWETPTFTAVIPPREDQLVYAVPASTKPTPLPPVTGERLVCDRSGGPQRHADWTAERDRERRAELDRETEKERATFIARCEKDNEERARKREAAAKKPKRKPKSGTYSTTELADLLVSSPTNCQEMAKYATGGSAFGGLGNHMGNYAPWCGIGDATAWSIDGSTSAVKTAPPTVNGKPVGWPDDGYRSGVINDHVVLTAKGYLGDVGYRCGRVRMAVGSGGVSRSGGGVGMMGGGTKVQVWIPAPGPVTWPDGSPAGKYTGGKKYRTVEEVGDKLCVKVKDVAELVCHPKATTKTDLVYPSRLD